MRWMEVAVDPTLLQRGAATAGPCRALGVLPVIDPTPRREVVDVACSACGPGGPDARFGTRRCGNFAGGRGRSAPRSSSGGSRRIGRLARLDAPHLRGPDWWRIGVRRVR